MDPEELGRALAEAPDPELARIALSRVGESPAAREILARPGVTSVLLGATKLHQLDDNLGAADVVLTDEDMAQLGAATAIAPTYATSQWVAPDRRVVRALNR